LDEQRSGMLANREQPYGLQKEVMKNISATTWLMKRDDEKYSGDLMVLRDRKEVIQ
jgi:hypothetical protein